MLFSPSRHNLSPSGEQEAGGIYLWVPGGQHNFPKSPGSWRFCHAPRPQSGTIHTSCSIPLGTVQLAICKWKLCTQGCFILIEDLKCSIVILILKSPFYTSVLRLFYYSRESMRQSRLRILYKEHSVDLSVRVLARKSIHPCMVYMGRL